MKEVRPTAGKTLQALFNILGDLRGLSFLDLFSGTGRVARHALERGARPVVAVELSRGRAKEVTRLFSGEEGVTVLAMDVRRGVDFLRRRGASFDIIFADPPYGGGWLDVLGAVIFPPGGGVLAPGGVAVIEHSSREKMAEGAAWRIDDVREYGDTVLTFLSAPSKGGEE